MTNHATPLPKRRAMPAGHAFVVIVIALALGTLFNAQSLMRTAEALELGSLQRTVAVAAMRPVVSVSSFLQLDAPRRLIDQALGRDDPASEVEEVVVVAPPTPVETTVVAPQRLVTPAEPLNVWVVADSFGELFGPALVNRGTEAGLVDVTYDFEFNTGLSRPDVFDWPAFVRSETPSSDAEVAVAIFGGNDGQNIAQDGQVFEVGTPEWQEVYGGRVGEMMDALLDGVEEVYWIGMPIMESESFTAKVEMMNAIYRAESDERPDVTYVDIWELFQDENGAYATFLPDETGELVKMRSADHAHFYWGGAYRLSDFLLPIIGEAWGFSVP